MKGETTGGRREILATALLALLLAGALFLAERRFDWNPADEGYLWYGSVATAHGAVPLRDFRSYDPARYLWCAAWARLLGDGILALRFSAALFGGIGLFCGLRAARRAVHRWPALALLGAVLVLWMSPRHKLFEPAIEMALVLAAVRLIEEPTPRRYLALGAAVGFAAFVGKNHGLYGLLGSLALVAFLAWRRPPGEPADRPVRRWTSWLAGIALGASPFVAMSAIPGFVAGFVKSCVFFIAHGRTNVPVPVRWPWGSYAGLAGWELAQRIGVGACYVLWPAVCAAAVAVALATLGDRGDTSGDGDASQRQPDRLTERRLAIAAGFVGLFYLHHVFARADTFHLTQASHPMILAAVGLPLALPAGRRRLAFGAVAVLLVLLTASVALPQTILFDRLTAGEAAGERWVPYRLRGDDLFLHARAAHLDDVLVRRVARTVPAGEPLFIAREWPGMYVLLDRPAPVWDILPTWPGTGGLDEAMLAELRAHRVRWALLAMYPVPTTEGDPFDVDFPAVYGYLTRDFERVPTPELPRKVWLLRRREPGVSFAATSAPAATTARHGRPAGRLTR